MSVKTILAGAGGGGASDGTIELACRLAHRFGAHLETFHVRTDAREIMMAAGGGDFMAAPVSAEWIDRITEDAAEIADKTKKSFAAAVLRHDMKVATTPGAGPSARWHEATGIAPLLLPERARFFDLVVLGRSDRVLDRAHSEVIEQTLLISGRPVLLAPATPPDVIGESVAVGWDGSPQAVRAVTAALPCLVKARSVFIITIGDDRDSNPDALQVYLSHHGIAAKLHRVTPVAGVGAGPLLLSTAREIGADLLVIGGYGHALWREFLFGGATRDTVGSSLLPLLLQH